MGDTGGRPGGLRLPQAVAQRRQRCGVQRLDDMVRLAGARIAHRQVASGPGRLRAHLPTGVTFLKYDQLVSLGRGSSSGGGARYSG